MKIAIGPWLSLLAAAQVASCAIVESSTGTSGLAYRLPKGEIMVVAQRKKLTPDDAAAAAKAASDAADLVSADMKTLAAAKQALTDDQGKAAAADPSIQPKLQDQVKLDQAVITYLTAKLSVDQPAADTAKAKATAAANAVGYMQETATITLLPVAPDPSFNARFVANLQHLPTRDDGVKLAISNNGLLSSSDVASTDETGNILIEIAEIVAAFGGIPIPKVGPTPPSTMALAPSTLAEQAKCDPYSVSMIFDPTIKDEVETAQKALSNEGINGIFVLDADPFPKTVKDQFPMPKEYKAAGTSGLFYRAMTSVRISIKSNPARVKNCKFQDAPQEQTIVAVVPDASQTLVLPFDAGAFTTTTQAATFNSGSPTSLNEQRPSEILAALGIPINMAKAIISIPTDLIKLRVNYDNQAAALTNAKVDALKAQLQALQAKQALDAAKAGGTNATQ